MKLISCAILAQIHEISGIELFERHGKTLALSSAGHQLRDYTQEIMQSYNNMLDFVAKVNGSDKGHLTISVATTANQFTTRILAAFSKFHPNVTISLEVTNRRRLLQQLENYEQDLVIMGEPPKGLELISEQFMINPLVIIAAPDSLLIAKKNLSLHDLFDQKFVVREKGSGTRETIERLFKDAGFERATTLEISSNEAIKQAVSAGFGLGVVSLHTIRISLGLQTRQRRRPKRKTRFQRTIYSNLRTQKLVAIPMS